MRRASRRECRACRARSSGATARRRARAARSRRHAPTAPGAPTRSDAAPAAARRPSRVRCVWCGCPSAPPGQRVEVVGHLGNPGGVHARGLGPLDVGEQLGDLAGESPRSAPIITPRRITPPPSLQSAQRTSRTRTSSGVPVGNTAAAPADSSFSHIGLRDGAADDDGDVTGVGRTQRLDGAGGQRQVRAGQDAKARRARRPPAARSTRCPRCAGGCRCR